MFLFPVHYSTLKYLKVTTSFASVKKKQTNKQKIHRNEILRLRLIVTIIWFCLWNKLQLLSTSGLHFLPSNTFECTCQTPKLLSWGQHTWIKFKGILLDCFYLLEPIVRHLLILSKRCRSFPMLKTVYNLKYICC